MSACQRGEPQSAQVCLRRFRSSSVRGTPSLSTIWAVQSGQQGTRKGSPVSSSRNSLPLETAHRSMTAGHPAVGQLGLLTAHHREEGAGADGDAQTLQVGDGLDDDGAGAGHRHLHLPLPLGDQVGRADDEHPLEARHVRRCRPDEGLAGSHLAHYRRAPVGFEGEGRSPYGVLLRPQGLAEQAGELVAVLRGPVEGRVGLHHPMGDG